MMLLHNSKSISQHAAVLRLVAVASFATMVNVTRVESTVSNDEIDRSRSRSRVRGSMWGKKLHI